LEPELSVRLVNRMTHAVLSAEASRIYYEQLRPLLDEFDNLGLAIRCPSASSGTGKS
jgi:DNA-binding transcriptional LysR family regulator